MKVIQLVLFLLFVPFIFLHSCQNPCRFDDPIVWDMFYAFVDVNNHDFFKNNPDYDQPKVFTNHSNISEPAFIELELDSLSVLGYESWTHEQYFDFGNGDVDTLLIVWRPANGSIANCIQEVDEVDFIYNDVLVERWDNKNRLNGIPRRNGGVERTTNPNPVFIKIPKKRNPEEFD